MSPPKSVKTAVTNNKENAMVWLIATGSDIVRTFCPTKKVGIMIRGAIAARAWAILLDIGGDNLWHFKSV